MEQKIYDYVNKNMNQIIDKWISLIQDKHGLAVTTACEFFGCCEVALADYVYEFMSDEIDEAIEIEKLQAEQDAIEHQKDIDMLDRDYENTRGL
ncbi:MAG: hypothetical protein DRQ46_00020 [Gammaproteobacteria bacterium]|nr:MAG: hypothetical protein DRQ46_00020 [Gammaproteobacteria bacterium]